MKLSDILLSARDHVAAGWVQHVAEDGFGHVCIAGAIKKAFKEYEVDKRIPGECRLVEVLTWIDLIHFHHIKSKDYQPFDCVTWNDEYGRSQNHVVDLLDTLAKVAKNEDVEIL